MKKTYLTEYEKKVLKETPGDYTADWELVSCGQCQFCGHRSKNGYWVTQKVTGKRLLVGTDCVFVLTNLDRKQQRVFKALSRRQLHDKKYAALKEYLETFHKDELVTTNSDFHKFHNSHYEIIKEDDEWVHYKWISNDSNEVLLVAKDRPEKFYKVMYVADYSWNASKTAKNIAAIIINKIVDTSSPINKYWFDVYKEVAGVDLIPMTKVKK